MHPRESSKPSNMDKIEVMSNFINCGYPAWPIDRTLNIFNQSPDDKNIALHNALWSLATKYAQKETESGWYLRQSSNAVMRPAQAGDEDIHLTYLYLVSLPLIR